jgi:hypothetical protein
VPRSSSASVFTRDFSEAASGSRSAASPRSTAVQDGSSPTIGMSPGSTSSECRSRLRAPSSWPVEIQVSPQHTGRSGTRTE